jgi:hypothetical protein
LDPNYASPIGVIIPKEYENEPDLYIGLTKGMDPHPLCDIADPLLTTTLCFKEPYPTFRGCEIRVDELCSVLDHEFTHPRCVYVPGLDFDKREYYPLPSPNADQNDKIAVVFMWNHELYLLGYGSAYERNLNLDHIYERLLPTTPRILRWNGIPLYLKEIEANETYDTNIAYLHDEDINSDTIIADLTWVSKSSDGSNKYILLFYSIGHTFVVAKSVTMGLPPIELSGMEACFHVEGDPIQFWEQHRRLYSYYPTIKASKKVMDNALREPMALCNWYDFFIGSMTEKNKVSFALRLLKTVDRGELTEHAHEIYDCYSDVMFHSISN